MGSHHYLLALFGQDSLPAKALAALGVTREAVEQQLTKLDPTGASDETPEQAGARRINLRLEGQLLTLEIDDPDLAASLERAMAGRTARIIRGTDPEAEAFPTLWSAVSRTVDDLTRRLGRMGHVPTPGRSARGEWRPPGWHPGGHAGVYWILSRPGGTSAQLECSGETDRISIRAWLRAWLTANGPELVASEEGTRPCCSLWAYVDAARDSFDMVSFGFGPEGPAASPSPLTCSSSGQWPIWPRAAVVDDGVELPLTWVSEMSRPAISPGGGWCRRDSGDCSGKLVRRSRSDGLIVRSWQENHRGPGAAPALAPPS